MQTIDGSGSVGADRAVLVALYEATGGANWKDNTNWLSAAPLDEWYGVTTDEEGRVLRLNLGDNELTGSIPAELAQLKDLRRLNLGGNELTGSIPAELAQLQNLTQLWLYGNELTGSIPAELAQLQNLTKLWLGGNELTGGIPSGLEYMRDDLDGLGLSFCR